MRVLFHWLVTLLALAAATTAAAQAPLVYATIEPKTIVMGESAQLTITNLGSGMEAFRLPTVPGLRFEVVGSHRQMELTNGTTLTSTATLVRVTPQLPGTYTIPPVAPHAASLVLQVNSDHGPITPKNPGGSIYQIRPPALQNNPADSGFLLTQDGAAFVKMTLPKRPIYVGESLPVDIEVGVRSGFVTSVNGLPTLNAAEFTLNNLSHHPERKEILIEGNPFVMLTWHSILAAVKPGNFSLAVTAPLTVKVSLRAKPEAALENRLGDPFLQNLFGPSVTREVNVTSPAAGVSVLALPSEGRPADFGGAVGEFKLAADLAPAQGAAGDPLTLRLHVSGAGNFDRVSSSGLASAEPWKTYPIKSTFTAADEVGYKGEKVFEQPVVAMRAGEQAIPALHFSYFDPQSRRYETVTSAPVTASIRAGAGRLAQATASILSDRLRPDRAAGADSSGSLLPLYMEPLVLGSALALSLALTGGVLICRRRGATVPVAAGAVAARLERACEAGDTVLFVVTAQDALRQHFATLWKLPAAQITAATVVQHLGSDGESIRRLFLIADEIRYAGAASRPVDFARWIEIVRHALRLRST
jgi:BatD DUF11 like domain